MNKPKIVRIDSESNSAFSWDIQECCDAFKKECKDNPSMKKCIMVACDDKGRLFIYHKAQISDLEAAGMMSQFNHWINT